MTHSTPVTLGIAGGLIIAAIAVLLATRFHVPAAHDFGSAAAPAPLPTASSEARAEESDGPAVGARDADEPLTPEEKAARVEKINRDYAEIRAKTAAEYSAAGTRFPGGLGAFLRQLALLEREKRADLSALLSPRELEELEMRETLAGQQVRRWLDGTAATEEQRRLVFRLQRDFDERFALTFEVTPVALLERETARHGLQEQIRAVLGDDVFASWLRGEGPDYGGFVAFAAREGLPPTTPLELWRAKNEFIRRRLELATQPLLPHQLPAAQAALARDIEARVLAIVGPAALVRAREEILTWLPLR